MWGYDRITSRPAVSIASVFQKMQLATKDQLKTSGAEMGSYTI